MNTCGNQSTLEMLPDEVLLEVCKYLLCSDILHSFVGLNYRITQMITQYRHHVSLHKTSISKFYYLYTNVLPQFGSQIRSLVIDCSYSILQHQLFTKFYGEKISVIFPNLQRISLVSLYEYEVALTFFSTLHDLDHLVEINLYDLFSIERSHQPAFIRSLFQANNHRLTTILIDNQQDSLSFNNSTCYLNVLRLTVELKTVQELCFLFAAVPNVQYLDVIIHGAGVVCDSFYEMEFSSLFHLTDFRLQSSNYIWELEELFILFVQVPKLQHLSLFLSTYDRRLIDGNIILSSLPSTVQQFNYAIQFMPDETLDQDDTIATSWPSSHPIACIFNDESLFIHTLPWHLTYIDPFLIVGKMIICHTNSELGYDRQVKQLDVTIDKNFTFGKSLGAISQCRCVREITIKIESNDNTAKGMSI